MAATGNKVTQQVGSQEHLGQSGNGRLPDGVGDHIRNLGTFGCRFHRYSLELYRECAILVCQPTLALRVCHRADRLLLPQVGHLRFDQPGKQEIEPDESILAVDQALLSEEPNRLRQMDSDNSCIEKARMQFGKRV